MRGPETEAMIQDYRKMLDSVREWYQSYQGTKAITVDRGSDHGDDYEDVFVCVLGWSDYEYNIGFAGHTVTGCGKTEDEAILSASQQYHRRIKQ